MLRSSKRTSRGPQEQRLSWVYILPFICFRFAGLYISAYRLHFEKSNLESIAAGQSSKLGKLRFFSSDFGQQIVGSNARLTEPIRRGGGPVFDMGIYCINAARYLFRAEPTEVWATSASTGQARFRKAEEMTAVTMKFPGERLASFTASFGSADVGRYTLVGTKGLLTADPGYEYAEGLERQIKVGEKTEERSYPKRDQFAAEIIYFSECILNNREPEPSGQEGLHNYAWGRGYRVCCTSHPLGVAGSRR